MGGPLRRQLEELDVVPLHAVDGHWGGQKEFNQLTLNMNDLLYLYALL